MKKLVATVLTLLSCGVIYALPLGNPIEASLFTQGVWWGGASCDPCDPCFCWFDAWSIRVGFYGDYVFNRNLKIDGEGLNQGHAIRETKINTNAGYLVLNVCNKIDVFGTVGASNIRIETSEISWVDNGNANGLLETDTHFSWSAGLRGTLFQWRCFGVGLEGQYFRTTPKLTKYWTWSNGTYNYFNDNNETTYQEWQVGIGLSYTFSIVCPNLSFVPYVGAKWSWVDFDTDDFQFRSNGFGNERFTIFDLESNKLWGGVVGMSFTMCELIGFTVEGRWGDETAIYVNGQFRF